MGLNYFGVSKIENYLIIIYSETWKWGGWGKYFIYTGTVCLPVRSLSTDYLEVMPAFSFAALLMQPSTRG